MADGGARGDRTAEPRRIALVGGSFDPVHCGHLAIARAALRELGVAKVWFIPARISPLKGRAARASDEDRLAMLRIATCGETRFGVSDCELRRGGVSYTVDTVREWKSRHPGVEILFVAGMDSLLTLRYWKDPVGLLSLCRFVTFTRPGAIVEPSARDIGLPDEHCRRLLADIVRTEFVSVSSSSVRERIAAGLDVSGSVPRAVARYIASRGLYRTVED